MNKKEVCIIGAGLGGLSAGAILAKKGHDVIIFEKEAILGGRALSLDMSKQTYSSYKKILSNFNMHVTFSEPNLETIFDRKLLDGYQLDLGYHVIGGGIISKIKDIIPLENEDIEIFESRLYEAKNGSYNYFVNNFEKLKMLPSILRLFLSGEKVMKELDNTSMNETIKKYAKGKTKIVLEVNSRLITTINNLDLVSAGEVFRTQKDMRLKGVRYPKNGLFNLSNRLAEFIKKNKGKIFLNKPVEKIIIENNEAKGIIANGKKYSFDMVLSNILVQSLFTIADKKHFPEKYVKELKSLEGSGSLCAYYSFKNLKPDLIGKTFVFIERNVGIDGNDAVGMIDFMTAHPKAGLSPPYSYLVQSYIICTPEEAKDKKILEKLRKVLDKNLEKIIKNYKSNLNWVFYSAIWHLDGVAKTILNEKPEIKTPVENLYLIGDCVKAPGIGINCAINSAKIVAEMIEKI
jgi:protoporphyrinogen oxidase